MRRYDMRGVALAMRVLTPYVAKRDGDNRQMAPTITVTIQHLSACLPANANIYDITDVCLLVCSPYDKQTNDVITPLNACWAAVISPMSALRGDDGNARLVTMAL